SGTHAIDYLGTFNFTETNADPCSEKSGGSVQVIDVCTYTATGPYPPAYNSSTGLGGIGPGNWSQFPIGVDSHITSSTDWTNNHGAADPRAGAFTVFGGTITAQG